jgi:dTDP-4-dehydrorhamnose reductase
LLDALQRLRPAAVLNAAGFTDVARAERPEHRAELELLNRDAPAALARACARLGLPLVQLSTDYVFDGSRRTPYVEDDLPAPLQAYGRSKLEGERAVLAELPGALVARTSTLYGSGARTRPHYVDAVLRQARQAERLEVVRTPVASPTYAPDLAAALIDLLDAEAGGVVHVANDGQCSRLELARQAVAAAGLPVPVEERPETAGSLSRPAFCALDCSRFRQLCGRPLRPWEAALREYVADHVAGAASGD